jgi:hypothetical protein
MRQRGVGGRYRQYGAVASLVALLLGMIASCSNPSDPASEALKIISVSQDTLFAGDPFVVEVDRVVRRDSLSLFIGSSTCEIDSVIGARIFARASTGTGWLRLRLYDRSIEASGTFSVFLLNATRTAWARNLVGFYPFEGKVGDTIQFTVDTVGLDAAQLNPRLHGVSLRYLSGAGKKALYTVPETAQDGPMQVSIFDQAAELYRFDVIRPETDLPFEEGTLNTIEIAVGV